MQRPRLLFQRFGPIVQTHGIASWKTDSTLQCRCPAEYLRARTKTIQRLTSSHHRMERTNDWLLWREVPDTNAESVDDDIVLLVLEFGVCSHLGRDLFEAVSNERSEEMELREVFNLFVGY